MRAFLSCAPLCIPIFNRSDVRHRGHLFKLSRSRWTIEVVRLPCQLLMRCFLVNQSIKNAAIISRRGQRFPAFNLCLGEKHRRVHQRCALPHHSYPCIIERVIELNIPGRGLLRLQHLVTDVNGTLALDGQLIEGLAKRIGLLKDRLTIHLLTADTHGQQAVIDGQLDLTAVRVASGNEAEQKAEYVRKLGAETVIAIGQGANDAKMLQEAALGICVMSPEGAAAESLLSADLVMPDIRAALELLDKPLRIVASLRK